MKTLIKTTNFTNNKFKDQSVLIPVILICSMLLAGCNSSGTQHAKQYDNPNVHRIEKAFNEKSEAEYFDKNVNPQAVKHKTQGNEYLQQNLYDKAKKEYEAAIRIDPNYASPYNNLGLVYANKQQFDKAIAAYKKAISLDPKFYVAYGNLGNLYYFLPNHRKEALQTYLDAVHILEKGDIPTYPSFALIYYNLGRTYIDAKDYEKAEAANKKAIEIEPRFAHAHLNLGVVYYQTNRPTKALPSFQKAVEINPKLAIAYSWLGQVYSQLKQWDLAEKAYQKNLELEPNNKNAQRGLDYAKYNRL